MGFIRSICRGIGDIVKAPFKAAGQVIGGVGKGLVALSKGDIGGFFTEPLKGVLKGGGELVHGALSGVKNLAGPVLTVAGGVAGFMFGGPFGAMAGAQLGGMLGGAVGGIAGGLDGFVQQGLSEGNNGAQGCQQSYQQQNFNDFGGGYNCGMPGNCGGQLPYSFYQGAQGYPGGQSQWGGGGCYQPNWGCQPNYGFQQPPYCQAPQNYGLAPEIARFYC